ncbi:MAG TPA: fasciclin domain-containing protein [Pseudonocardiaceae bacterium]|nr:fasciclin domain-containing protein [Pseudonocardiaceae bacterium]
MRKIQRLAAVGVLAALTAVVGACSNSQGPATSGQPSSEPQQSSAQAAPNPGAPAPAGNGVTQISDIFGPACSQVPTDGPGSAQGMVNDPVATAASHNPLLTTLTKAVTAANLVDTLNSAPALTVFAPSDSAFQALEAKNPGILNQLTTAPDAATSNSQLAKILTYHVVGTRYDAAGLIQAGTLDTLEGAKITVGGTAAAPTINGAPVLCGNIPTKNATVFIIGQVLSPPAS